MNSKYHSFISKVNQALLKMEHSYAFVGGMAVGLYETRELEVDLRPTEDLDCVVGVTTRGKYFLLQEHLRAIGFTEDTSDGAPICRWKYDAITVDIMPLEGDVLGFTNPWYGPGLDNVQQVKLIDGSTVPVFSFPYFLASKLVAMNHRDGGVDLRWNHDFEDVLHLLVHRKEALTEIQASEKEVQRFLLREFKKLLIRPLSLKEAIHAHFVYKAYPREVEQEVFSLIQKLVST
jgi:hypothetical protein